eukprot:TRINITY_DN7113_c0_g2_i1.p1 TRINITY_DN7113_c0_g2~~TRINITY_DN7113_c0_g2_i1.p1  ORF type:complete len:675 (-),score=142.65 TRINITY_DN7113_c0_g2_i1:271-2295(-)
MPLTNMRSPLSMLRRFTGTQSCGNTGDGDEGDAGISSVSSVAAPKRASSRRRDTNGSSSNAFQFMVPEGYYAGETVRVQGPDGGHVDVVLPEGCRPGQQLRVEVAGLAGRSGSFGASSSSRSAPNGSLVELVVCVKETVEATRASIASMTQRLREELEMQKALWASAGAQAAGGSPVSPGQLVQLSNGASAEDLSQTQALVFAAAEFGNFSQLLAALAEAKKFSAVTTTLEACAKNLSEAEEALVTWHCLLDALQAKDVEAIEIWLEHAKGLGLEVPAGMKEAVSAGCRASSKPSTRRSAASQGTQSSGLDMARCREVHRRLLFALETDDPELLQEVLVEARSEGFEGLPAAREVMDRLAQYGTGVSSSASRRDPATPERKSRSRGQGSSPDAAAGPDNPAVGDDFNFQDYLNSRGSAPNAYSEREQGGQKADASDTRTVKELMEECRRRGLDTAGCTDRNDLLKLLRLREAQARQADARARASAFEANSAERSQDPWRDAGSVPGPAGGGGSGSQTYTGASWQPGGGSAGGPFPQPSWAAGASWGNAGPSAAFSGARAAAGSQPVSSASPFSNANGAGFRPPTGARTTVWDRQHPPSWMVSKRSKALWLLGFDPNNISRRPSAAELRSSYRKAAMESHPDKQQNHTRQAAAKELFQEVKAAYDYLMSPDAGLV